METGRNGNRSVYLEWSVTSLYASVCNNLTISSYLLIAREDLPWIDWWKISLCAWNRTALVSQDDVDHYLDDPNKHNENDRGQELAEVGRP